MNNHNLNLCDYLLTCLSEECGEVLEELLLKENNETLKNEINDLIAISLLLEDANILKIDYKINELNKYSNEDLKEIFIKQLLLIQKNTFKAIRFGLDGGLENQGDNKKELISSLQIFYDLSRLQIDLKLIKKKKKKVLYFYSK